MDKPAVAFVCIHNSCRSQIAEAIARAIAADAFRAYSAGTNPGGAVNEDATRVLGEKRGIRMAGQAPKHLDALPAIDIVIAMGCGVECPSFPARHREDWGLEDPTGKDDEAFRGTIHDIEEHVRSLRARILAGCFDQAILASNLKALGDANRLRIIELLKHDEDMCARRLLEELDISQSTLSHHMTILCDAHLVQARRDGRWTRYRLDKDVLAELASTLVRGMAE